MTTGDEYREMARKSRQASQESWERSDTDGFLTQWASDATARMYDFAAEIADNGGKWTFQGLYDLDGNLIADARYVETRYGWSWVYDGPNGTVWFRESSARKGATRRANDEKKGHRVGTVLAPAKADLRGKLTLSAVAVRLPGEAIPVTDGTDPDDYPDWT